MLAEAAPKSITVQGHRGARTVRPENTLPAFEFAIEAGADVLELDLGVTSDNVLVVHHDQSHQPQDLSGP
jgi:glycerophosphoryl diester phosphodiesterase